MDELIKHAEELFPYRPYLTIASVDSLREGYVKARRYLGNKWILSR